MDIGLLEVGTDGAGDPDMITGEDTTRDGCEGRAVWIRGGGFDGAKLGPRGMPVLAHNGGDIRFVRSCLTAGATPAVNEYTGTGAETGVGRSGCTKGPPVSTRATTGGRTEGPAFPGVGIVGEDGYLLDGA